MCAVDIVQDKCPQNDFVLNAHIKNMASFIRERDCSLSCFGDRVDLMNAEVLPELIKYYDNEDYAKSILLKISNLLMAKYQYVNRHESLVARPFGIIVDPSNTCQLRCPGCIHNDLSRKNGDVDWPPGFLDEEVYDKLLQQYGPYAIYIHFFNWGEPLLNRKTPVFISKAKKYMLATSLSSNLSIKFDAEALVLSGLDYLIMSIDGASSESYQKYRRGGDFNLVLRNLQELVRAKQKYNLVSPTLCWQFLVFEHNVHEIECAKRMAEEMGVDVINFAKPYDVSWAAPELKVHQTPPGRFRFPAIVHNGLDLGRNRMTEEISPYIASTYRETWGEKSRSPFIQKESSGISGSTCRWLYKNMVMDAHGRIFPCCYAPKKNGQLEYVYSLLGDQQEMNHFDAPLFRTARRGLLADHRVEAEKGPFCLSCKHRGMKANIDNDKIVTYFSGYYLGDLELPQLLDQEALDFLADWEDG